MSDNLIDIIYHVIVLYYIPILINFKCKAYTCMRADRRRVRVNVSHQHPEHPKIVVFDKENNLSCSRV